MTAGTKRTLLPFYCLLMGVVSLPTFLTLIVPASTVGLGVWALTRVQAQGGSVRANIITMLGMSFAGVALLYGIALRAEGYDHTAVWAQVKILSDDERKLDMLTASNYLLSIYQRKFEDAYGMLAESSRENLGMETFQAERKKHMEKNGVPRGMPLYDIVEEDDNTRRFTFNAKYPAGRRKIQVVVREDKIVSSTLTEIEEDR